MLNQNQPELDLSDKQSEAWHYLEDDITTEVGYGGGAGGGKSFLGCAWHIHRRAKYPGSRGLIGRAKITNLEESTLITLKNVCHEMGYIEGYDYTYNSQKHIIAWRNGSKSILKDLFLYPSDPDFISLGSTEFTDNFIEEANEITLKAYEIVNSRIRYKLDEFGLIPKTLFTCNPGPGWIKDNYIIDNDSRPIQLQPYQKFVQSLVYDNPNKSFSDLYSSQLQKISSEYDQRRLLHGDWEVEPGALNPFAHQFAKWHESERAIHMPDKQLYMSVDFNLNPFAISFFHLWLDDRGLFFYTFDCEEIKNGSIPAMISLIKMKYENQLPNCLLTGDSTGDAGDMSQIDNASKFEQLRRGLGLRPSQVVIVNNPKHTDSRTDCNYLLYHSREDDLGFFHVKINPQNCKGLIRDLKTVQCDAYGSIIKRDRKDITQRSDLLDTFRSAVHTFVKKYIINHQKSVKHY